MLAGLRLLIRGCRSVARACGGFPRLSLWGQGVQGSLQRCCGCRRGRTRQAMLIGRVRGMVAQRSHPPEGRSQGARGAAEELFSQSAGLNRVVAKLAVARAVANYEFGSGSHTSQVCKAAAGALSKLRQTGSPASVPPGLRGLPEQRCEAVEWLLLLFSSLTTGRGLTTGTPLALLKGPPWPWTPVPGEWVRCWQWREPSGMASDAMG